MKKFLMYGGSYVILQIVNNEVLTWVVITVLAAYALCKWFPIFMEGTK